MLKDTIASALKNQIYLGRELQKRVDAASTEIEIDALRNYYEKWNATNSSILEKGFMNKYVASMYNANATLGNQFEQSSFIANRDFLIKSVPYKLERLVSLEGQLRSTQNRDLGIIDGIVLSGSITDTLKTRIMKKLFISHSSKDDKLIEPFLKLLTLIGLPHENVFYCSEEGYGLKPGENIIDGLKRELSHEQVFALFMVSDNFYNSQYCMCEMGAVWIKSHKQIHILLPPMDTDQMKGVFSNTIALKMIDRYNMNTLKSEIEQYFGLKSIDMSIWEKYREDYFNELTSVIKY